MNELKVNMKQKDTRVENILKTIKNNKILSILIIMGIVIVALGTFIDAVRKIINVSYISHHKIPVKGNNLYNTILNFKSKNGDNYLLETLYGYKFDINSPQHIKILRNIEKQIKTNTNNYGVSLDVDRLELIYNRAKLSCRDLADLEIVLQNQLEIYEHGRELIIRLWGLRHDATFENDTLLRQLVADYESKIRTSFRTKGIRLNLKTKSVEEVELNPS